MSAPPRPTGAEWMRESILALGIALLALAGLACGAGNISRGDSPSATLRATEAATPAVTAAAPTPTPEPEPAPPLEPTGVPVELWAPPAPTEAPAVAQAIPEPAAGDICPGVIPSVMRWADLISRYGWDLCAALRIIDCESDGDPWVMNAAGSGACGLWQHLPCEGLGDPELSTAIAWDKYSRRGWQPWTIGGCFPY